MQTLLAGESEGPGPVGQTFRLSSTRTGDGLSSPAIVATCHGIEVPEGPHLAADLILSLRDGSFAKGLLCSALAAIQPSDRVLYLGTGEGVLAAVIARNCRPTFILGYECDPNLVAQARALHRHNGLDGCITLRHGQVLAGPDAPDLACDTASASPVTCYEGLRRTVLHNVIVMDIDGTGPVFLRRANLSGVRLVLVRLQPHVHGREGVRNCRRALGRAGYERDLGLSGAEVDVFRRVRA